MNRYSKRRSSDDLSKVCVCVCVAILFGLFIGLNCGHATEVRLKGRFAANHLARGRATTNQINEMITTVKTPTVSLCFGRQRLQHTNWTTPNSKVRSCIATLSDPTEIPLIPHLPPENCGPLILSFFLGLKCFVLALASQPPFFWAKTSQC